MKQDIFLDHLATVITNEEFDTGIRSVRFHRDSSVPNWLYEYEEDEITFANECYETQKSKNSIDIKDFFRDLRLSPPFCDRLPGVPVCTLLPFYNHIIVWLEPYRSVKTFKSIYGISPDAFADLCGTPERPGKIIPILNATPPAFAGISHFERILELRPPTMWRDFFFQRALVGAKEFAEARREANEIIPKRLTGRGRFASLRGTYRGTVRDLAISCYSEICSFGGRDLAKKVVQNAHSNSEMVDLLFYYSLVLYDSLVSPLGGTYPCTHEQIRSLVGNSLKTTGNFIEEFPVEIGKSIIEHLNIPLPSDKSISHWWVTEARDIWRPARKALKDLEKALDDQNIDNLEKKRTLFQSVWNEAANEIHSSKKRRSQINWTLNSIGIIGSIGGIALSGLSGIIASIVGTMASGVSIFDIKSIYSRVFKPNHLVSIVDLHQYLKKHPVVHGLF